MTHMLLTTPFPAIMNKKKERKKRKRIKKLLKREIVILKWSNTKVCVNHFFLFICKNNLNECRNGIGPIISENIKREAELLFVIDILKDELRDVTSAVD